MEKNDLSSDQIESTTSTDLIDKQTEQFIYKIHDDTTQMANFIWIWITRRAKESKEHKIADYFISFRPFFSFHFAVCAQNFSIRLIGYSTNAKVYFINVYSVISIHFNRS